MPEFVKFVSREPTIDEQLARKMLVYLDEHGPVKPWTLAAEVSDHDHQNAMDTLRPLVHRGVLTPTADGDIRIHDRTRLDAMLD